MNDCVTDQFIGVLQHTQRHVIDELDKSAYDAEAAAWSASLWAETGSGLPPGFHADRDRDSATNAASGGAVGATVSTTTNVGVETHAGAADATAVADGKSPQGSTHGSDDGLASMSTAEISAQVDSMLTLSNNQSEAEATGRAPRQP